MFISHFVPAKSRQTAREKIDRAILYRNISRGALPPFESSLNCP